MARRSGFNSFLVLGYGKVNILEVAGAFKATCVQISKVVEQAGKVSVAGRSGFNSFLDVRYSIVNILEVTGAFSLQFPNPDVRRRVVRT